MAPVAGVGVDFTQIQPAVDAAADGDILLVRTGTYPTFLITAKSLTIAADPAVSLTASGVLGMRIQNLRADQSVVVRGFTQNGAMNALEVTSCQGAVLIEDCAFRAVAASFGGAGALVYGSPLVTLTRCELSCRASRPGVGGGGLSMTNSFVTLHACLLIGESNSINFGSGWPAAAVSNGMLFAAGCSFFGGSGAPGANLGVCLAPGNGADAIRLIDGAASAVVLDCTLTPGRPGSPGTGCPPGSAGQTFGGPGTGTVLGGAAVQMLSSPTPVRMGQIVTFSMVGPPGALTWLALSPRQAPIFTPACNGVLHADLTVAVVLAAGFLDGSGQLGLPVPVPALGVLGTVLHVQAAAGTSSGCFLSAPAGVVAVDPRF